MISVKALNNVQVLAVDADGRRCGEVLADEILAAVDPGKARLRMRHTVRDSTYVIDVDDFAYSVKIQPSVLVLREEKR